MKARGDGLEFDMGRAALQIDSGSDSNGNGGTARLWLDGVEQPR